MNVQFAVAESAGFATSQMCTVETEEVEARLSRDTIDGGDAVIGKGAQDWDPRRIREDRAPGGGTCPPTRSRIAASLA